MHHYMTKKFYTWLTGHTRKLNSQNEFDVGLKMKKVWVQILIQTIWSCGWIQFKQPSPELTHGSTVEVTETFLLGNASEA